MNEKDRFHVVFYGELAEGQQRDAVKKNLISMFRLSEGRIDAVFAGKPLVVKDNIDYQTALKYKNAFEKAGTQCKIVAAKSKTPRSPKNPKQNQKHRNSPSPSKQARSILLLAPNIPEEKLDLAIQSYAHSFQKDHENALLLIDRIASAGALLLSDRRLYIHKINTPPRRFKLTNIRSVDFKQNGLFINKQPVLSLPGQPEQDIQRVIRRIQQAIKESELHPVEELPPAGNERQEEPEFSGNGALFKNIAVAAAIVLLLGLGFTIFRKPSKEEQTMPHSQAQIIEQANAPQKVSEAPQTSGDPAEIVDTGTPCRNHAYRVQPSVSTSLNFSRWYPADKETTTLYESDPEGGSLGRYGARLDVSSVYFEEVPVEVWAFDGRSMFHAVRNASWYKSDWEVPSRGIPYCIPETHSWSDLEIRWQPDGYGIVERVEGVRGRHEIAKLSEQELKEKLSPDSMNAIIVYAVETRDPSDGGILTKKSINLSVRDSYAVMPQERFELSLDRYYGIREKIQHISMAFSTPGNVELDGQYTKLSSRFIPSNGEAGETLSISTMIHSSAVFEVFGPAFSADCLRP